MRLFHNLEDKKMKKFACFALIIVSIMQRSPADAQTTQVKTNSALNTGIVLKSGDSVKFRATGIIRFGRFTPTGGPEGVDPLHGSQYNLVRNFKHGALIGRIGNNVFYIGKEASISIPPTVEGVLMLGVNDTNPYDNIGEFTVEITVSKASSFDPFKVSRGQLTFDIEGQECPDRTSRCYIYHSRKAQAPSSESGVTIGRGYDTKLKSPEQIKKDLMDAGLREQDAEAYAKAGCRIFLAKGGCKNPLQGDKAKEFINENQDKLVEITPEQQKKLFEISYSEKETLVKHICTKEDAVKKYGAVNWEKLNPKIKDTLVDLAFRGDYTTASRTNFQKFVADNDFSAFKEFMGNKYWTTEHKPRPVPPDRFNRRVEYLNN